MRKSQNRPNANGIATTQFNFITAGAAGGEPHASHALRM
jgi:hypothetical protein